MKIPKQMSPSELSTLQSIQQDIQQRRLTILDGLVLAWKIGRRLSFGPAPQPPIPAQGTPTTPWKIS